MNLVREKREEFQICIRNQKREELFKLKRSFKQEDLPFAIHNNTFNENYFNAFSKGQFQENPNDQMLWVISRIRELGQLFIDQECNKDYGTTFDIDTIFTILNKGFPQIDKTCLEILLSFTLPNHSTCKPMLKYLPELLQFYLETGYDSLKSSTSLIFLNLCADCYQCRDSVLVYEIPQKMYQSMKIIKTELIEDLAQIIINIARMRPFISTYNQIQIYRLSCLIFKNLKNEQYQIGILQFFSKMYSNDKNLADAEFIASLCYPNTSQEYQLEMLSLIRVLSLFDRAKYLLVEEQLMSYMQNTIKSMLFNKQLEKSQVKIVNKLLSIFSNLIIENSAIIKTIANSNILSLFQFYSEQGSLTTLNSEIYTNIYFYSFYIQIVRSLDNDQLKLMNQSYQPMKFLLEQLEINSEDENILLEILSILEIIIVKEPEQLDQFHDFDGRNLLAKLSRHESERIYIQCERLFELIE